MFTGVKHPQVYVFEVDDTWTQVMLLNNDKRNPKVVSALLSGDMTETGSLGLNPAIRYHVFDFWKQKYLGKLNGTEKLSVNLLPLESVICSVRKVLTHPQVLSTNRHVMQGMVELHDVNWSTKKKTLSGKADVIGDEDFIITIALNGSKTQTCVAINAEAELKTIPNDLADLTIKTNKNKQVEWFVSFR